jgi:hypothetical protein
VAGVAQRHGNRRMEGYASIESHSHGHSGPWAVVGSALYPAHQSCKSVCLQDAAAEPETVALEEEKRVASVCPCVAVVLDTVGTTSSRSSIHAMLHASRKAFDRF